MRTTPPARPETTTNHRRELIMSGVRAPVSRAPVSGRGMRKMTVLRITEVLRLVNKLGGNFAEQQGWHVSAGGDLKNMF